MLESTPTKKLQTRTALGKGLSSLIPSEPVQSATTPVAQAVVPGPNKDRHPGISVVSIDEIQVNPYQPRRDFDATALEELAQSIRVNGLIQPLVVRKMENHYELIAGERRFRASRMAGLAHLPIVIRKSTDKESLELALIENIQRENLNCVDEALAYFQLMEEFKLTQDEVAERVGKERVSVAQFLRLLKLPEGILDDLRHGKLSFGHGKALLGLQKPEDRLRLRGLVIEKGLSVRECEAEVKKMLAGDESTQLVTTLDGGLPAADDAVSLRLKTASQDLTRKWFTRVEVKGTAKRGRVVLNYGSSQELDRLLDRLLGGSAS